MIDSIKVSEVTDVVTPEEETYPPNYNFSMESTWEEQTFSAGGEGGIIPTGTKTINITQNGVSTHNVKTYESVQINTNVPNPSTGTKQITANGTHDVTDFASAEVNVPNSYSASDEGKVVSNGELTAQTSRQITSNGTVDTTLNDEVVVNVPTGITPSGSQTFTQNGTYDVTSLAEAVVNVASGGGMPSEITGYSHGSFTLADDSDSVTINHGLGNYPTIIYLFADYNFVQYKNMNKGTTVTAVATMASGVNHNGQLAHRYLHATSGNPLSNVNQPLASKYQGDTATVDSYSASYPFPSKYHMVDGDEGTTITWKWYAFRLA